MSSLHSIMAFIISGMCHNRHRVLEQVFWHLIHCFDDVAAVVAHVCSIVTESEKTDHFLKI